jgi:hypothetical protein
VLKVLKNRTKNQRPESTEGQMTKKQIEERFKNAFNGEEKLEGKLHLEIELLLAKRFCLGSVEHN